MHGDEGMNSWPHFLENIFLLSYPKAGRTWVRVMLAKLSEIMGGDPKKKEMIRYKHPKPCFNGEQLRFKVNSKKIILLYRDPRDIVVSNFFQVTLREKQKWNFKGNISKFIRDEKFGIGDIINFYNIWLKRLQPHPNFMFLKYEDLIKHTPQEFMRICSFLGISITQPIIDKVVAYSSFENMKKMDLGDKDHLLSNKSALGGGPKAPYLPYKGVQRQEAMKIRKGVIGGYKEYLNPKDIKYVNRRLLELDKFFGYV